MSPLRWFVFLGGLALISFVCAAQDISLGWALVFGALWGMVAGVLLIETST